jgi:hypothetical protein
MNDYTTTDLVIDLVDAAGYGITWADQGRLDEVAQTYTLDLDEDAALEAGKSQVTVTFQDIQDALAKVAQGEMTHQVIAQACQVALESPEDADIDSETADCVIQVAVFGEVVFG